TFLQKIKCDKLVSIIGNHDKRNRRAVEFFRRYINGTELIIPHKEEMVTKSQTSKDQKNAFVNQTVKDINFTQLFTLAKQSVLVVGIDTNIIRHDTGYVAEDVLDRISDQITHLKYDECLMLSHHSVLGTDECPLVNSLRLTDFIDRHKIKHVFCGHTHEISLMQVNDRYRSNRFTQYMCGSTSSANLSRGKNMFIFYEGFGNDQMKIHVIHMQPQGEQIEFEEEII
ncbi:MAG: metallophosphoesterase, partial [Proteobacteria bacterium]|nr:metallophosphoesterase [Pseudomonadota bacterium]